MSREYGTLRDGMIAGPHPAARAPRHIVAAVNRARRRCGLPPIDEIEDRVAAPAASDHGTQVLVDPRSRIAPRTGRPLANGFWPASAITATITRVVMLAEAGTAPARATGRARDERIVRGALGLADSWNASPWLLRDGHGGMPLAVAGPRLRAVDTPLGVALEWIPDPRRSDHADALRRIEAGGGCSVAFCRAERIVSRGVELLTRARLMHAAIVANPAYSGAVARVYRDRPAGPEERQRQIRETVAAAMRAIEAAGG